MSAAGRKSAIRDFDGCDSCSTFASQVPRELRLLVILVYLDKRSGLPVPTAQ